MIPQLLPPPFPRFNTEITSKMIKETETWWPEISEGIIGQVVEMATVSTSLGDATPLPQEVCEYITFVVGKETPLSKEGTPCGFYRSQSAFIIIRFKNGMGGKRTFPTFISWPRNNPVRPFSGFTALTLHRPTYSKFWKCLPSMSSLERLKDDSSCLTLFCWSPLKGVNVFSNKGGSRHWIEQQLTVPE